MQRIRKLLLATRQLTKEAVTHIRFLTRRFDCDGIAKYVRLVAVPRRRNVCSPHDRRTQNLGFVLYFRSDAFLTETFSGFFSNSSFVEGARTGRPIIMPIVIFCST